MKITLTQEYEIEIPREYETLPKEELLNNLNAMYDINGKYIIKSLNAEDDYMGTTLTHIDDDGVYMDGNEIGCQGSIIVLDGQPIDDE